MSRLALIPLFASLLAGCGYSSRVVAPGGGSLCVAVPLVESPGLDVDASAFVDEGVRREVARAAGLDLVSNSDAQVVLHVEIVDVRTQLAPFAEPALRAAQYQAVVRLRGRIERGGGRDPETLPVVSGTASYLSTGGPIERLDGAGRRALAKASASAASRLVDAMVLRLRR